ncbi:12884_t:CDS:10 [Ambispora gerdemannii]|uniref:12884_t:CDS:1 n=1 Tax=Ambispora gerdemannii TaxID=144530 RepID=A0A9N8UX19_9GLOM|nr:12884_t:CDS:10 [Ambispora gerdemannii]
MSTWEQVRKEVRAYRSSAQPTNLFCIKDFCFDQKNNRVYFLATDSSRVKTSTLYMTGKPQPLSPLQQPLDTEIRCSNAILQLSEDTNQVIAASSSLSYKLSFGSNEYQVKIEWSPLLPDSWLKEKPTSESLSREEMFVKERRRMGLQGITSFQFEPNSGQILFSYGSGIYLGQGIEFNPYPIIPYSSCPVIYQSSMTNTPLQHMSQINSTPSSYSPSSSIPPSYCSTSSNFSAPPRLDPKLGGRNNNLIAFIRDRDIWVTTLGGSETQLTFCNDHDPDGSAALSCGVAEFVMQEEFHRFTGYYWAPSSSDTYKKDDAERILYIQVSESMVDLVVIPRPGPQAEMDEYRYPRAGTQNALCNLQIVEFIPQYDDEEVVTCGPTHKRLWGSFALNKLFPWMEYIVRFGWFPSGNSVWVQLLDRLQQRTAIVKIALCNFMSLVEYQNCTPEIEELYRGFIEVIFEERNHIWINVTEIYYFFNEDDNQSLNNNTTTTNKHESSWPHLKSSRTKLIVSSERSGFRHLYLVTKPSIHSPNYHVRAITCGEWPVIDRPIYVDTRRELVYFMARKDTPLETHLYVASFSEMSNPNEIIRLTDLGYSHVIVMDEHCHRFLDWFSSLSEKPKCGVRYLEWEKGGRIFPSVSQKKGVFIKGATDIESLGEKGDENDPTSPIGKFFEFLDKDGVVIYGCVYHPDNYIPGKKYPTLLSIYGGPKSQMVTNDYKFPRYLRLFLAARLGFTVVLIDGRGSSDRGLYFEGYLKNRMGSVELEDQIAGLQYLAERNMGVDLDRVAITGWSYGGYLSLMALAQYPQFFKIAIAGAPVTQWELYDTAYTERYMGMPSENVEGYRKGSVLNWADKFPDGENRLLIVHGQIDENVHYKNSELLVSALVKINKPHVLQSYPTERHGLRHANVAEHFETLMFFWLINYL